MAKSHLIEKARTADAIKLTKRGRRTEDYSQKHKSEVPKRQTPSKQAVGARANTKAATKRQTKQQICLDLLNRREGATIEELQAATGWQQHSVRGFLAGAVKKKLGLALLSEKPDAGSRRYRISDAL